MEYMITYTKMMSWHYIEKTELVLFLMNNSLQQFLKIWFMKIICPFIYSTSYYIPITVQFCQCLFICLTTWHNLEIVLLIKHAFSCCSKNSVIMCFWMKAKHRQNLKVRFPTSSPILFLICKTFFKFYVECSYFCFLNP
jgi:hypothetical protein